MNEKKTQSGLKKLAQELISPSDAFEPRVPQQDRNMLETLGMLESLEKLARQSLVTAAETQQQPTGPSKVPAPPQTPNHAHAQPKTANQLANEAIVAAALQRQASRTLPTGNRVAEAAAKAIKSAPQQPAPKAAAAVTTSTADYRPALNDSSLVEALLALQQRKRGGAQPKGAAPQRSAAPAPSSPPASARPGAGFEAPKVPQVEAALKPAFQRLNPSTMPVLRPSKPTR